MKRSIFAALFAAALAAAVPIAAVAQETFWTCRVTAPPEAGQGSLPDMHMRVGPNGPTALIWRTRENLTTGADLAPAPSIEGTFFAFEVFEPDRQFPWAGANFTMLTRTGQNSYRLHRFSAESRPGRGAVQIRFLSCAPP